MRRQEERAVNIHTLSTLSAIPSSYNRARAAPRSSQWEDKHYEVFSSQQEKT